jgi:PAS domain S-box-containing protein
MSDQKKTKAQLIEELTVLRRQLAEYQRVEAAHEATEDALRTEKALLDELFQHAPEAVVLVNNESFILRANQFFTTVFGYTEEEVVGKNIDVLLAPDHLTDEAKGYTGQVARGERLYAETVRQHKDGTLVDVSMWRGDRWPSTGSTATSPSASGPSARSKRVRSATVSCSRTLPSGSAWPTSRGISWSSTRAS